MPASKPEKGVIRELYGTFFGSSWPMWVGGILLSTGNILLFLVKSPWGGSGGYVNWGQNFFKSLGLLGLSDITSFTIRGGVTHFATPYEEMSGEYRSYSISLLGQLAVYLTMIYTTCINPLRK